MPADAASSTSPAVIVFTLLAIAAGLYAWWLSIDRMRRLRRLARWLEEHRTEVWSDMPAAARLSPTSGIDYLRQGALAQDPDFIERYRHATRHGRRSLAMQLLAAAAIAIVAIGTRNWGWGGWW